jgi:hypothetical protein
VPDHFDELLERIRDIRASERRMYLRVREIDYQLAAPETMRVFQIVQNKLHFAATGKTAPELIAEPQERPDADRRADVLKGIPRNVAGRRRTGIWRCVHRA